MNIRDVYGVSSPHELYELATVKHKLHAGSMGDLIAFVAEMQKRALAQFAAVDGPAVEIRVLGETE